MKVIQINSTVNKGSTGRIAEQIGKLILERGDESIIAYGRDGNASESKLFKIGDKFDFALHGFYSLFLGRHGEASKQSTYNLINYLNKEKPDILHLHNLHGYYLNFPIFFRYLSNTQSKIVWTLHDCWAFTGHCSHFSDINCIKWKTKCFNCPKKRNYPKSLFFDNSSYFYDLKYELFNSVPLNIIAVSKWLEGLVKNSFLRTMSINCISNGVDESIFRIQKKDRYLIKKYNLDGKTVLLASSTSWAKQKGFDDYLSLSNILSNDEILILLGIPDRLKRKLPKNIIAISRTESVLELAKWYSTADIVLNLSYQESFGLTSVEGFMCGKPTIVYNTTASPELIINKNLGLIVEPGNIRHVADAVKMLKNQEIDSIKIRQLAIENFSARSQYLKYISLYESLLLK